MPDTADTGGEILPQGMPDLPLIIEQLQNQLDDLREALDMQQTQLAQQAARLAELERR